MHPTPVTLQIAPNSAILSASKASAEPVENGGVLLASKAAAEIQAQPRESSLAPLRTSADP